MKPTNKNNKAWFMRLTDNNNNKNSHGRYNLKTRKR